MSIFAILLSISSLFAPETVVGLRGLLDTGVRVEKSDGSTLEGRLVGVDAQGLTVRLRDGRLATLTEPEVAAVVPLAAPVAAKERSLSRDPEADVEKAETALLNAQNSATAWSSAAGISLALGCAQCGIWAFVFGAPFLVIGSGIGLVAGAIAGFVAATQWFDVSAKRTVLEIEQSRSRRDEPMPY